MSSKSNAAVCESDRIDEEFKKRWKKFNQIRPKPNNYQFRMSINNGAGGASDGGRLESSNNGIKFSLAIIGNETGVNQRPKSPPSNPWTKLCCFGKSSNQHEQQALQLESRMIFSRMDRLERDVDALAKCIKKETKKKIAALKEAEEQAAAEERVADDDQAAEEAAEQNVTPSQQPEDEIIRVQDSAENIPPTCSSVNWKPDRVKTKTKTVHKENIIGVDGTEEDIVVSKRELLDEGPVKQKRVVTTKEAHSFDEKKGYTVVTNEKYVKDKGGKYSATKKEVIKGKDVPQGKKKDQNVAADETTQSKQKYSLTEHRIADDGTKHEVMTHVQEKTSPKKQTKKIVTEHKAEAPRTDGEATIYEKTTTDIVEKKR